MKEIIQKNRSSKESSRPDPRLLAYVAQCKKMQISDQEIRKRLLKTGRKGEEIDQIMGKEENTEDQLPADKISKFSFKEKEKTQSLPYKILGKEKIKEKNRSKFFSKKIIFTSILILIFFSGYYFFTKRNYAVDSKVSNKKVANTECSFNNLPKPGNTGSAVVRVDSTMKLLIKAFSERDYCLVVSLYAEDSRDKYKELIETIISDEIKRSRFLIDLSGYMIPAIDENNPESEARVTITSKENGTNVSYTIKFSKTVTGEYLISSI